MPTLFVSDATGEGRLAPAPPAFSPGWAALSALYQASFAACGFRIQRTLRPEIYASPEARTALGARPGDCHLAVKPIEHLRPFHGLPNLFVCDWPFPELSSSPLGGSPFFDQLRLLQAADAVLCTTPFTTATLHRAGVGSAVTLSPQVPPLPLGNPGPGCRFLCVVEAGNLPRQLGLTLEGFAQAAASSPRLHLTLRLRGGSEADLATLRRHAAARGAGDQVDVLPDEDGDHQQHFFLCAHAAPGLYLPLLHAMAAGLPPVTTRIAGTASYLPPGAAIPIATHPDLLDGDGEPIGRFLPLTSHPATAEAIRDALLGAASLDEPTRRRMADAARTAAQRHFSAAAFESALARLLPNLQR